MITELKMSRARRNRVAMRTSVTFVSLAAMTLVLASVITLAA